MNDKVYTMTRKFSIDDIKKIFKKERKDMLNGMLSSAECRYNEDTLRFAFSLLYDKIDSVANENELSELIGECCRMSIQEWINSLPLKTDN